MPITTNNLKVETKDFDKAQIDEVINGKFKFYLFYSFINLG